MTLLVVLSLLFTPVIPARSNLELQKPHTEWQMVNAVQSQQSFFSASRGRSLSWSYIAVYALCLSVLLHNRIQKLSWLFAQYKHLLMAQAISFRLDTTLGYSANP